MTQFKKAKIIVNPTANHGETSKIIGEIEQFFEDRLRYDLVLTTRSKEAIDISRDLASYDLAVAVGGDGTSHEVANGLALSANRKTALAFLPTGSGNDFARMLGISSDFQEACEQILNGQTKLVDIGKVNDVYFNNSLGIGFDARVAAMAARMKQETTRTGLLLYLSALFLILFNDYYCHDISFQYDDSDWIKKKVVMMAANIGITYGGGFHITPHAVNDDGLLDVCYVDELSVLQVMMRVPFVIPGWHEWMRPFHSFRARKLKVRSEKELPVQVDGEMLTGLTELNIEVVPKALKVVIAPGFARVK
jgi:YegS/Rv2252/BmrU family lipid kinase